MLPAIHFNDEQFLATDKVTDVTVDRFLPHEYVPINLPIANPIPEHPFRVGLIDAQRRAIRTDFLSGPPTALPLTRSSA